MACLKIIVALDDVEVEKGRSGLKDVDGILRCQESGATVNILDKQLPEVGLSQD